MVVALILRHLRKNIKSLKHLLWHGNTEEALERLGDLLMELSLIEARSNAAKKVVEGLDDFRTYICNNREFIPNFGERRRQGETISTAFVESTINQVVSRRFVKKQQMQWTLESAKKSGVRISKAEVSLRPYPSSHSFCELFYKAWADGRQHRTPDFLALSEEEEMPTKPQGLTAIPQYTFAKNGQSRPIPGQLRLHVAERVHGPTGQPARGREDHRHRPDRRLRLHLRTPVSSRSRPRRPSRLRGRSWSQTSLRVSLILPATPPCAVRQRRTAAPAYVSKAI